MHQATWLEFTVSQNFEKPSGQKFIFDTPYMMAYNISKPWIQIQPEMIN